MKRFLIFSDCSFSQLAIHKILTDLYKEIYLIHGNHSTNASDADYIIFVLTEHDIFQCSEFFIRHCKDIGYEKIILIGKSKAIETFQKIMGRKHKSVNIKMKKDEVALNIDRLIKERKEIQLLSVGKSTITSSEIEVIRMLQNGFTVSEIAIYKERSPKTISKHKCNFLKKIGARNRAAMLFDIIHGRYRHDCNETNDK